MRTLQLHCDYMVVEAKQKALKSAPPLPKEEEGSKRYENVLVVFTSFEQGDNEQVVEKAAEQIKKHFTEVKADLVLIHPYAHLSSNLAKPDDAVRLLGELHAAVKKFNSTAGRSPFGYYKSFEMKCKGHPLAELSRTITAEGLEKALPKLEKGAVREDDVVPAGALHGKVSHASHASKVEEGKEVVSESLKKEAEVHSKFYVMDPEGELVAMEAFDFKANQNLRHFADYEVKKVRSYSEEPPHIKLMKEHRLVDYEPASDSGHFRWLPKGLLVKKLLERHVSNICVSYGALQFETPIMYSYQHPALKSYLHRFPARQYVVKSDDKEFFLRFSACFGQFLAAHDATISYKDLPLKMYELTHYSFRREQGGELAGLKRLRAFTMPDMHTLCGNEEQARQEFEHQYNLCLEWNNDLRIPFEAAFRVQEEYFEKNKKWYQKLVRGLGRPAIFEIFKERYAYFVTKFEFNFIDNAHKASGLSTVQIDVENGERFDINYVGEDGKKHHPTILHCSVPGAVDRVLYALLEGEARKQAEGKIAMIPLWLSPSQVRIVPVSEKQLAHCEKLLVQLKSHNIRAELDDREETMQKKVREAEKDWVPLIAVVGEKEILTGKMATRIRETHKQEDLDLKQIIELVRNADANKPFEQLSLPDHLSRRPLF